MSYTKRVFLSHYRSIREPVEKKMVDESGNHVLLYGKPIYVVDCYGDPVEAAKS